MNWWNNGGKKGKTMPAGNNPHDSLGEFTHDPDRVRQALTEFLSKTGEQEEPPPGTVRRHRQSHRPRPHHRSGIRTLRGDTPHFIREGYGMPGDIYQLDIGDVIEMNGRAFLVLKADPQWMHVDWLDCGGVAQLPVVEFYTGTMCTVQPNMPIEFHKLKASPINLSQYETTEEVGGSVYPGDEVIIDRTLYMVLKMNEDWMTNETNHTVRMKGGVVMASRLDGALFGVSRTMKMEKLHYIWEGY